MENSVKLKVTEILENPLNMRSMEADQINLLAENIEMNGLMQPLAVYDLEDGRYMLVSGHRRLAAIKKLGQNEVLCVIVPAPKDEFEESEKLTAANFARRKSEDLVNEILRADQTWNTMDPERRKKASEFLKKRFITEHESDVAYIANPTQYVSTRYRPIYEYIRLLTGLDLSNSTIKNVIAKYAPAETPIIAEYADDEEDEPEKKEKSKTEKKEKSEKRITTKDISKGAASLRGMLMGFTCDDPKLRDILNRLEIELNEAIELLKED